MAVAWSVTGVIAVVDAAWMAAGTWQFAFAGLAHLGFATLAMILTGQYGISPRCTSLTSVSSNPS